ncbi:MAG: hypothetical protein AAFY88_31965, partial [Acidobacteriota bacterium]
MPHTDPPPPRVACLVLNYNGRDITLQALESLGRMTYPAFDRIHVDNGSTDGSGESVAAAHPFVDLGPHLDHVGMGGGDGFARAVGGAVVDVDAVKSRVGHAAEAF